MKDVNLGIRECENLFEKSGYEIRGVNDEFFDSKKYIGKFIYKKNDSYLEQTLRQQIIGNLYLKEIRIDLLNRDDKVVESFGYSLEEKLESLLPLLLWEDFEKTRDRSGWDLNNNGEYRDGWGYDFACMNDSGNSLIQNTLDVLFKDKNKPAYELLLDWIIKEYSGEKEFKIYKFYW